MPMAEEDLEKIADMVCRRIQNQLICKPLGVAELADFLGVEKSWVYGRRDLPYFMAGKHKRFMVKDVLDALGYAPRGNGGNDVQHAA